MRDRPARLIAVAALVAAVLGWTGAGDAVRSAVLPAKSVGTTQLRDNAVTAAKIRSGSVMSADVKNGSLRSSDLFPGTIPRVAFVLRRAVKDLNGVGQFDVSIACETGQTAIAGGGGFLSATTAQYVGNEFYGSIVNSGPLNAEAVADDRGSATGWKLTVRSSGGKKRLVGYVVCASVGEVARPKPSVPKPPSP